MTPERVTCEQCGGEYMPVQADGRAYEHVCPPAPRVTARPERSVVARAWLRVTGGKKEE